MDNLESSGRKIIRNEPIVLRQARKVDRDIDKYKILEVRSSQFLTFLGRPVYCRDKGMILKLKSAETTI